MLAGRLSKFAKNVVVLRGGMGARRSRAASEALREISDREERVLVATGRYLGEGFDDARLDTLFLTMPISWHGTLSQYAGRLPDAPRSPANRPSHRKGRGPVAPAGAVRPPVPRQAMPARFKQPRRAQPHAGHVALRPERIGSVVRKNSESRTAFKNLFVRLGHPNAVTRYCAIGFGRDCHINCENERSSCER